MYRTITDFVADWKAEEQSTLKIFSGISDEKITVKVAGNIRSLGQLAWHITQTLTEMPHKAGIVKEDSLEQEPLPVTFDAIASQYKKYSKKLVDSLKKTWKDTDLNKVIELYGEKWEKGRVLSALITHQIHHRAQMTVLMRLQGMKVPGLYGPAREDWANFGMPAPE
jgi:uncharacterized damage-inducible protein DinB